MIARWRLLALGLIVAALSACGHVTNDDQRLCAGPSCPGYDPQSGYRFDPGKAPQRNTLVVVTLSGGGVRASALAYGTLLALKDLKGPGGASLLDDVDIISSVSGGSVTAGWYALRGHAGLEDPAGLKQFLYADNMAAMAWRGLNPAALTGYLVTDYQRSDTLTGYFADRLFKDSTYAEVDSTYRTTANQPFVILNATDLGHEIVFPFTQGRFDLLCSDLARYRLADAVAASANFPIVFSPIGVRNYSPDCRAHDATWQAAGPPQWIDSYLRNYDSRNPAGIDEAGHATPIRPSNGLLQLRAARSASDYVNAGNDDHVVHLLDGGVVDNLGIQSVFAIEDDPICTPGLFQRLATPRPPAYRRIDHVLFVVVNARSRDPAGIDAEVAPPDIPSSLLRMIDTSLDSTILSTQNYLTSELQAIAGYGTTADAATKGYTPRSVSRRGSCWCNTSPVSSTSPGCVGAGSAQIDRANVPLQAKIVTVDFEMIPYKPCRDRFWGMSTSWTLPARDIDDLVTLPRILLSKSPDLKDFYKSFGTRDDMQAEADRLSGAKVDFTDVCS